MNSSSLPTAKSELLLGGLIGFCCAVSVGYVVNRVSLTTKPSTATIAATRNREEEEKEKPRHTPTHTEKKPTNTSSPTPSEVKSPPQTRLGSAHEGTQQSTHTRCATADCVYWDYNATTPVYREVYEAMRPFFTECFGNPSSSHIFGDASKAALLCAREHIAALIHATDATREILFTSCGTESDNRAIDIALHHYDLHVRPSLSEVEQRELPQVITSAIEHPAVLCYLRVLKQQARIRLAVIGVNSEGFVQLDALTACLSRTTALVTIMHSNNEVGTVQPVRAIAHAVKTFNARNKTSILVHSDAAQSIGKVPIDVQSLGVDLLTIVGHKFGAPKGIAALFIKKGLQPPPLLIGGGQENGMRAGTENVPYAVALGEAARIAKLELNEYIIYMLSLKLKFFQHIERVFSSQEMSNIKFNGPVRSNTVKLLEEDMKMLKVMLKPLNSAKANSAAPQIARTAELIEQLPNTISVSFKSTIGHELVAALGKTIACSAGSACHSAPASSDNNTKPEYHLSEVLQAMHADPVFGLGTLRLTFGRHTVVEEVEKAVPILASTVQKNWKQE